MKSQKTKERGGNIWRIEFLFMALLSLFFSGCSYHANEYSYFNMLDSEKRTLQNKKAAEKFWSSVRPVSTLSGSHYKLGIYYLQQEKYHKAIEEFTKAVWNDNNYCKAYNGIAMSYDALKNCEKATYSYEQAMQCDPGRPYIYNNYACSSLLCGDYEKGLALLQEAAELSEDNSRIKNNLKLAQATVNRSVNVGALILNGSPGRPATTTTFKPSVADIQSQNYPVDQIVENSPSGQDENADIFVTLTANKMKKLFLQDAAEVCSSNPVSLRFMAEKKKNVMPLHALDPEQINSLIVRFTAERIKKIIGQSSTGHFGHSSSGAVELFNGNGVKGMAARTADYFRGYGFQISTVTDAPNFRFNDSVIYYREGHLQEAKELAGIIPGAQEMTKAESFGNTSVGVRVLLGKDLVSMQFPQGYVWDSDFSGSQENTLMAQGIKIGTLLVIDQDESAFAYHIN